MKGIKKLAMLTALGIFCAISPFGESISVNASEPTGYTKAEDVVYAKTNGKVANWGVREEKCTFLSTYAEAFYQGTYSYEFLSKNEGGTSKDNAVNSALFSALQSMMKAKHKTPPTYQDARYLFGYTDCERSDTTTISCFYSATDFNNKWDQGNTWNREHTWPKSKSLNGSRKGGDDEDDFIMLRPTLTAKNSDRGNTAYGENGGFFDPGEKVRGDCARIALYVYTRWNNTQYMWGQGGVMESLPILLKWMEEDPVDTWEMGRNDAVESITGTRNVFVDYPEYAWLLFGEEIPVDMTTPSRGNPSGGTNEKPTIPSTPSTPSTPSAPSDSSSSGEEDLPTMDCEQGVHDYSKWITIKEATDSQDGLRMRTCYACGHTEDEILPATNASPGTSSLTPLIGCNASLGVVSGMSIMMACAFTVYKKKK